MFRKILGTIGCIALVAMGTAIAAGWMTLEQIRGSSSGGRGRAIRETLASLVESLGPLVAGAIAISVGLLLLWLCWRPRRVAVEK